MPKKTKKKLSPLRRDPSPDDLEDPKIIDQALVNQERREKSGNQK